MPPARSKFQTKWLLITLLSSFGITAAALVVFRAPARSMAQTATNSEAGTQQRELQSLDQKDGEAQHAMDHAKILLAEWKEDSLRKAIEEYDRAGLIWRFTGDFTNASRAILKSGEVYFFLSQYPEALKKYQEARDLAQKESDRLSEASALSQMARVNSYLGNNNLAQKHVTGALELLSSGEATPNTTTRNAKGEALLAFGEVIYAKGNFKKALTYLDEALEYLEDDGEGRPRAHMFIAYINGSIGNSEKAAAEINRALDLYKAINHKSGEGLALSALGKYYSLKPNKMRAIELQLRVRQTFRDIGDRHSEAIAHNGLGEIYENLRDNKTAYYYYESALQLFEESGSLDGASVSMCNIARMQATKNLDQALRDYERCLSLSRAAGKYRSEANALNEIAKVYAAQGHLELASKQYQRTQKIYEAIGDLRGQANALNSHGDFLFQSGKVRPALDAYNRALPLSEQIGDQNIRTTTFYNLARAHLKLGSLGLAHDFIQRSLGIIEDQRANLGSPEFRLSYFSGVQNHYELLTEILMEFNRRHPGEGFDSKALFATEKGRARLLYDLITEAGADFRLGTPKELLDLEREIRGLFRSLAQYRLDLSLSQKDSAELAEVDDQLTELKTQYQEVLAQLRPLNPRSLSFVESAPLSLEQIQKELRDSNTMILEYALGDERSYLWAITSNSFHSYELAPRKEIENLAHEVYKLISVRRGNYQPNGEASDKDYSEKISHLSQRLLGPLAGQLGNPRLVVISEGALQYIPFDVLHLPTGLLIKTNEVVASPSISTLIEIRRAMQHTGSTSKLVAVIADPVFSPSDDRVQSQATSSSSAQAATEHNPPGTPEVPALARLAYASEEANAITAMAPWATTMVAKGFDASRETAMSADVGQYQIVHFATHGVLDSERPELSGIVLTSVDRNGGKTNGLMPLQDIYNLDLSAQLTVLSACQTALGKDVKGEGFIGLTHGILSAGSKSVVASLWKVDDRATNVLMGHFYDAMLQKGLSPAAALRLAKLKMMEDKQWNEPYFWAGFVLQGEYTNHIAVDHYSWFRSPLIFLFLLLPIAAGLLIYQRRKRRLFSTKST